MIKKCAHCGAEFTPKISKQRYCSKECSCKAYYLEHHAEILENCRKYREAHREEINTWLRKKRAARRLNHA